MRQHSVVDLVERSFGCVRVEHPDHGHGRHATSELGGDEQRHRCGGDASEGVVAPAADADRELAKLVEEVNQ
jgi:hypothetical protein